MIGKIFGWIAMLAILTFTGFIMATIVKVIYEAAWS